MSNKKNTHPFLFILLIAVAFATGCTANSDNSDIINPEQTSGYKTVTDMRGVEVTIPKDPQRVVAMSRSLIDTTMYIFGKSDRIVGASVYQKPTGAGTYVYNGKDYTVNNWIALS
ncbi:MAG: ABC transporter substrate-binding protein [Methanomicrobiaceae archaeon]|nr:ABC transporter substrate-binding protein [Methanomicrobiaceae archaeon]